MGARSKLRDGLRDRGLPVPAILIRPKDRTVRQVARALTREDTVLDLGAHLGIVSMEFAMFAGRVHAFEPTPRTFAQLCHNTRNHPRITPVNKAVSDRTGTARLFFDIRDDAAHFTDGATLLAEKSNVADMTGTEVQTVRLSEYIAALDGPVKLIKMDIEGAEYRVIGELIETDAIHRVGMIHVEPHEDRIPGLTDARARVEARIAELDLSQKFSFDWR